MQLTIENGEKRTTIFRDSVPEFVTRAELGLSEDWDQKN
jgi:hypothetical protein